MDCANRGLEIQLEAELELARHREHLEELVAARTEALRFANQELEAFSYSASHDLQAPLRSMRGFAEIVLEDYGGRLDEQGRSHLQRIVRAGSRMSRMSTGAVIGALTS